MQILKSQNYSLPGIEQKSQDDAMSSKQYFLHHAFPYNWFAFTILPWCHFAFPIQKLISEKQYSALSMIIRHSAFPVSNLFLSKKRHITGQFLSNNGNYLLLHLVRKANDTNSNRWVEWVSGPSAAKCSCAALEFRRHAKPY